MTLNYFKDHLFDLLNESELLDVQNIEWDDNANTFQITVFDGTKFDLQCEYSN